MSLEDGVRRMTSFPARRFGLSNKGMLLLKMNADIVVLDPKNVIDVATFQNPHQYSKGIKYVLVNGKIAVKNGKSTGLFAGKALIH